MIYIISGLIALVIMTIIEPRIKNPTWKRIVSVIVYISVLWILNAMFKKEDKK